MGSTSWRATHGTLESAQRVLIRAVAFLLVMATLLVGAPEAARAATVTVCPIGCDYTLPDAAANDPARASGDVIQIEAGTYVIGTTLQLDYDVSIIGAGSGSTIIDAVEVGFRAVNIRDGATAEISGLTIRNGDAGGSLGGGISVFPLTISPFTSSNGTLIDVTVEANASTTHGGGIENNGGTLTLIDSSVQGNLAGGDGAGIYTYNEGTTVLDNTDVAGNTAGGGGGGLRAVDSGVTVIDSRIQSNTAGGNGAGVSASDSFLDIRSSLVAGNDASGSLGGGIASTGIGNTVLIENSTVTGNLAEAGGGIGNTDGTVQVLFSTISGNDGDGGGGVSNGGGAFTLSRSLIAGNTSTAGAVDCAGGFESAGYNLIGQTECTITATTGDQFGTPATPLDPLLGTLADNGGPTDTFALLGGSPAIDAADACSGLDQRGVTRPQGPLCDIGAYEANVAGPATIQEQLDAVGPGGEVVLPAGTYYEAGIVIGDDQTLRGDGVVEINGSDEPGVSIIQAGGGDFALENLIITKGISPTGAGLLMGGNSDLGILSGVTFDANAAAGDGGAVYVGEGDELQVNGSTFTGNSAVFSGGAIVNEGGTVTVTSSAFTGNAASSGSAIANDGALTIETPDLTCVTPTDVIAFPALTTFADGFAADAGGAIWSGSGTVEVHQARFSNNSVDTNAGGAIAHYSETAITISCSVFDDNSAVTGGAVYGEGSGDVIVDTSLFAANTATVGSGGAVAANAGGTALAISDSRFQMNTAGSQGGAITSALKLIDTANAYVGNSAEFGGAIFSSESASTLASADSTFTDNSATTTGGAISTETPLADLSNATFDGNAAPTAGALYNAGGMTIVDSAFTTNQAAGGTGGAIHNLGDLALQSTTIDGNGARFGGGLSNFGTLEVSATTVSNNVTAGEPGDLSGAGLLAGGPTTAQNSTFSGNSATDGNGGAIAISSGTMDLNQVTIVDNHADSGAGGAMYNDGGFVTLSNSLFAFNTSQFQADCSNVFSLGYNFFRLVGGCTPSNTDIAGSPGAPIEPVISPLQDNGGPTETHTLLGGSPAIDAADPGAVTELESALANARVVSQSSGSPNADGVLTDETFEAGSFFAAAGGDSEPYDLTKSFSTSFSFLLDPMMADQGEASGDGFTFAVVPDQFFLGEPGGRLGIGTASGTPSVAVEFDTYFNGADPNGNHLGVNLGGVSDGQAVISTVTAPIAAPFDDGNRQWAWIDYQAGTGQLDVYVATDATKPASPQLSTTVDIAAEVGETGFFGFTGAGGLAWADQSIVSWELTQSTCEPLDQRGAQRPVGAACDMGSVEVDSVPPSLSNVVQVVDTNSTEPGVVEVPLFDVPIEKITGSGAVVEASPLASIPLASIPLASIDLSASPLASIPLASIPLASITIEGSPLASIPLASIPLASIGGWSELLEGTDYENTPLQAVTLDDLDAATLASVDLADITIQGSPLASITLPSIALGSATISEVDTTQDLCATPELAGFACDPNTTTLLDLEVQGAPLASIPLASIPLASIDLASTPLASIPLASIPLASIPLASIPLASIDIEGAPLASIPLASISPGSTPLASIDLLGTPLASIPLASIPLASIPLASIDVGDESFCDYLTSADPTVSCASLGIDEESDGITELIAALENAAPGSTVADSPLASIPLASIDIANVPLASIPLASIDLQGTPLASIPLASIDLGGAEFCEFLGVDVTGTAWCTVLGIDGSESLLDLAVALETNGSTIADTPLASIPLASIPLASIPLASIDLEATELAGTPLASIPLASIDILGSPLASIPLASIPLASIAVTCDIVTECTTLGEAAELDAIAPGAELSALAGGFGDITFGELVDALTLAFILGNGTFGDTTEFGELTFGQLLMSLILASDYPWEELDLDALGAQEFSADNFVQYGVGFDLDGSGPPVATTVTASLPGEFLYVGGSAATAIGLTPSGTTPIADPEITDEADGTQTLVFDLGALVPGDHYELRYDVVPALRLGSFGAAASVDVAGLDEAPADSSTALVTVIEAASTNSGDSSDPATTEADILYLGNISSVGDIDYFQVPAPPSGYRVAVFLSNLNADADLVMYRPATAPLANERTVPLDGVPIEDDGVDFSANGTEEPDTLADIDLLAAPLASISTNRGTDAEEASAISSADPFTIQVSGYNGDTSDEPYVLRVKVAPEVPTPQCSPRSFPNAVPAGGPDAVALTDAALPDGLNAIYLINWERLSATEGTDPVSGQTYADLILEELNGSATAPGLVDRPDLGITGLVIPVEHIADYSNWDANPCDVDAANAIADQIIGAVNTIASLRPTLRYVTVVGSDEIIPMVRKPDLTTIANESTFTSDFADNALYGSAITRHYLSDDPYADLDPIPWLDRYLNVPELALGRLVEGGSEIVASIRTFNQFGGALDPQTALTAGYDFLFDGSQAVDDALSAFVPTSDTLLDPVGLDPTLTWGLTELRTALGLDQATPDLPDVAALNMHYDFDEALPSRGDATGDSVNDLFDVTQISGLDQVGDLYFTAGCHSGLSVADVAVAPGLPAQDWAQTYAQNGALYVGQTGYGYGDTVTVALTEKLMAQFARNLDGTMTIGQAMTFAKQAYFSDLGLYGVYDEKALQEATFYGLPMYTIGSQTPAAPLPPLETTIDPSTGLQVATISATPAVTQTTTVNGELFSVDGDTQFVHYRPIQPIVRNDVTQPGLLAHGALLTDLVTRDITNVDIAFGRPIIDFSGIEPEVETDAIVFPTTFANVSLYNALPGPDTEGPVEERQQLNVIVGQFTSPEDGATTGTERVFTSFDTEVFYADPSATDFTQPDLTLIQAGLVGGHASFSVTTTDDGDANGVKRVVALYRSTIDTGTGDAFWESVDLVQTGDTWTGGGPVDASALVGNQLDYLIQAVDEAGNVGVSTFKGLFHKAEELPEPPVGDPTDPGTQVEVTGTEGENGWYLDEATVVVAETTDVTYEYSVNGSAFAPVPPEGIQITQEGVNIVVIRGSDGSEETFGILVDTMDPVIDITSPLDGVIVEQGSGAAAAYTCTDAGSGVTTCEGTLADGTALPTEPGSYTLAVTAADDSGRTAASSVDYTIVEGLELTGPTDPIPLDESATLTATITDSPYVESASWDWESDGIVDETCTNTASDTCSIAESSTSGQLDATGTHIYAEPGVYTVTLTIDYGGAYSQETVYQFVVVYDPDGGFVTGGGWFDSEAEAYTPENPFDNDPDQAGKATFGFVSKYKRGKSTPDGATIFGVHAAGITFVSWDYDWLVISGSRARYQGRGYILGDPHEYQFRVTVLDADVNEADAFEEDRFRIEIYREEEYIDGSTITYTVYDNGFGADGSIGDGGATELGGGSIKIHKARKTR